MKQLLPAVVVASLLLTLIARGALAQQAATYRLAVGTSAWAEYEVVRAFNMTIYGHDIKAGDRLRYRLVGTGSGNMTTWWGELLAYVEVPMCDVRLNGELVATNVLPSPFNITFPGPTGPFWPASEAFWRDCERWFNSSEKWAGLTIQEYEFDVGEEAVTIILNGKGIYIPLFFILVDELRLEMTVDKDTGVVRAFSLFVAVSVTGPGVSLGNRSSITLKLVDTNVAGALPGGAQGWLNRFLNLVMAFLRDFQPWLILASLVLAVVALALAVRSVVKLRRGLDELIKEVEEAIARRSSF